MEGVLLTPSLFEEDIPKTNIGYTVREIDYNFACRFIEKHHYSHNMNGVNVQYTFGLLDGDQLIGACAFGQCAMNHQADKWYPKNPGKVLELRRLVLVDATKRNAESFFIGRCLRLLAKHTDVEYILSYADPEHGHTGIIYRASNFTLLGRTASDYFYVYKGKKYHSRTPRLDKPFAKELRQAILQNMVEKHETEPKYIYGYALRAA